MKKLFVVRIGNYWPELCRFTIPTIKYWADHNDYEYVEITERRFGSVITLEKFQVFDLAKDLDSAILIDADCMLRPDFTDPHIWSAPNIIRSTYGYKASSKFLLSDTEFQRDGRNIGASTGFVWWTKLTNVVWEMHEDLRPEVIKSGELHIMDEYLFAFNIAKYGLHYDGASNFPDLYVHHFGGTLTALTVEQKKDAVSRAKNTFQDWKLLWPELDQSARDFI